MPPAAGLPLRLRPGLSRRRSSACAAARPGAPAGHRTRRVRASPAIASTVSRRGWRRPDRTPKTIHDRGSKGVQGVPRSLAGRGVGAAVAGTCRPRSRNRSFCCSMFFCASARVGASVPRPHATSPKPAALAHAARARCRRPAAQCPAPTAAWVTTGATGDTHSSVPEGRAPSRTDIKTSRRSNRSPLSSRAIPALSPRRRVRAKLPGCRHPDAAARAGPGRRCPGPAASALAPRRSSAQPGSPGRAAGPVSPPAPRAEIPGYPGQRPGEDRLGRTRPRALPMAGPGAVRLPSQLAVGDRRAVRSSPA